VKETRRWKDRWKIQDLLADGRCSRAVLDFLYSTDVGRRTPTEREDAVSEMSKAEPLEWMEEQVVGAEEPDAGGNHRCSYLRPTSWRPRERKRGRTGL